MKQPYPISDEDVASEIEDMCLQCESPIEEGLFRELATHPLFRMKEGWGQLTDQALEAHFGISKSVGAVLTLQHQIGPYRLDILLRVFTGSEDDECLAVAIECDGHDFHERTKQQAARDRRRDRVLTTAGFVVLRFTGSEIHKSAQDCADEVWAAVQRKLRRNEVI